MTENTENTNVVRFPHTLESLSRLGGGIVGNRKELGIGFFLICQIAALLVAACVWAMWSTDPITHRVAVTLFLGPFIPLLPLLAVEVSGGKLTYPLKVLRGLLVILALLGIIVMLVTVISTSFA